MKNCWKDAVSYYVIHYIVIQFLIIRKKEICEQLHRVISIMKHMFDYDSSASIEMLSNSFYKLCNNTSSSSKFNNAVAFFVIFKLNQKFMDRGEFMRIVVENSLSGSKLASRCEVYVMEPILYSMTKCEWEANSLSSNILFKLKSKPDTCLDMTNSLFSMIPTSIWFEKQQTEFIQIALKHIRTCKNTENIIGFFLNMCNDNIEEVTMSLLTALEKKQVTQFKHHEIVYRVLHGISLKIKSPQNLDIILQKMTKILESDENSISIDESCKISAVTALISWLRHVVLGSQEKGYKSVLKYFSSSMIESKVVRFRFTLLFKEEESEERFDMYICDMFQICSVKMDLLEKLIDNAIKKVISSNIHMTSHLLDGLIASYISLVSSVSSSKPLSSQVSKLFSSKNPSFLFGVCMKKALFCWDPVVDRTILVDLLMKSIM